MKKALAGLFKKRDKEPVIGEFVFSEEDEKTENGANREEFSSAETETGEQTRKNPLNAVPFEWARPVVENTVSKQMNREITRKGTFFIVLLLFFVAVFGLVLFFKTLGEKGIASSMEENDAKIREFEAVAENISIYKSYIEIPNNPSVYTQFYGIAFLAARNGFLVEKISFSSKLSSEVGTRINRDSFAIDMGKKLENVKIQGIWTLTGVLSPRLGSAADSGWSMNFAKQVNILFAKQNVSTYTRMSAPQEMNRDSSEAYVTILLWK